jgi:hypothetical protein
VPEVREVVRAFEEALTEALKAPESRERVFREVFMERVERLVEEYMPDGATWRLWRGLGAPPESWPRSPRPWAGGLWRTSQPCSPRDEGLRGGVEGCGPVERRDPPRRYA